MNKMNIHTRPRIGPQLLNEIHKKTVNKISLINSFGFKIVALVDLEQFEFHIRFILRRKEKEMQKRAYLYKTFE